MYQAYTQEELLIKQKIQKMKRKLVAMLWEFAFRESDPERYAKDEKVADSAQAAREATERLKALLAKVEPLLADKVFQEDKKLSMADLLTDRMFAWAEAARAVVALAEVYESHPDLADKLEKAYLEMRKVELKARGEVIDFMAHDIVGRLI